jgi:hypothetical protein
MAEGAFNRFKGHLPTRRLTAGGIRPARAKFSMILNRMASTWETTASEPAFPYSLNVVTCSHWFPFRKLHRTFRLPHNPPVDFLPSRDGSAFINSLPFDPPISARLAGISRISGSYGLCGGMSSAAYDFLPARLAGQDAPDVRQHTAAQDRHAPAPLPAEAFGYFWERR